MTPSWPRPTVAEMPSLLAGALLLFVAAAFLLPTEPAYALVFYASLLLAALQPAGTLGAARLVGDAGAALSVLLIVWSALTLLWGHDDGHRSLRFAAGAACTLAFFVMSRRAWLDRPEAWRRLGTVLIWAGAANAMLSLALGPFQPQYGERLHGWGATSHPILGASVMTIAYLAALCRVVSERRLRVAHLAACLAMALFIVETESRGPLFAALITTLFVCAAGPWRRVSLASLAGLAAAWFLLPGAVRQHQAGVLAARGSSHRFEIWHRTLQMVAAHPMFGNGLAANLDLPGMTFPHDLYLSVLFYSGAVGLALFAALAAVITLRLWRGRHDREGWVWVSALWINTLLSGLTDLGQITKGPGPMWFIFWLPVGLALARSPVRGAGLVVDESHRP